MVLLDQVWLAEACVAAALEAAGFGEAVNFSFVAPRELEPFGSEIAVGDGLHHILCIGGFATESVVYAASDQ